MFSSDIDGLMHKKLETKVYCFSKKSYLTGSEISFHSICILRRSSPVNNCFVPELFKTTIPHSDSLLFMLFYYEYKRSL